MPGPVMQVLVNQKLIPAVPDTWEVDIEALQLYKDRQGNPLELGHGASGKVTPHCPLP